MEDKKNSFYDFLLANSDLQKKEETTKPETKKHHLVFGWLVVFFANVLVLHFGWNHFISPYFKLTHLEFYQSILFYSFCKVLTRGFFSLQ